jgi:hypothetical protein
MFSKNDAIFLRGQVIAFKRLFPWIVCPSCQKISMRHLSDVRDVLFCGGWCELSSSYNYFPIGRV